MAGLSWLRKEQEEVEREIIRLILNGDIDALKPNCPDGIIIREHRICVLLHKQDDRKFQVWEWHGHIFVYDPQSGFYDLEYIDGHYYERLNDNISDSAEAQSEEMGAMDGVQNVEQNVNDDSQRFP